MKKILFILIVVILCVWSFFIEPNMLTVTTYKIQDKQLSGLRVVFIGDLHIKPKQQKRLSKVVELVNAQKPDIVLSVGDYVSGHEPKMSMPISDIAISLKGIKSKYGFYTVLGNHDSWQDDVAITKELMAIGVKVLDNNNVKLKINNSSLYIAGVEDYMTQKPDLYSALDGTGEPTILLTHSPDIFPHVPEKVALTLAGHLHGGQVRLPLLGSIIVPSKYGDRYSAGLITEKGKNMIVTKGIGNSIMNLRFNCVPEIVVIEFK